MDRATEIDSPIEAVIEMAIASFLDTEALGFADCKLERGQYSILAIDRVV